MFKESQDILCCQAVYLSKNKLETWETAFKCEPPIFKVSMQQGWRFREKSDLYDKVQIKCAPRYDKS